MRPRGFTLVELVVVIAIAGILAALLTVFLRPAVDAYLDTGRRATLTDVADNALRRMATDIRRAVPNSIHPVSSSCFRLVPTIAGGRYRMASDTVNDAGVLPCTPSGTCSAPLDVSTSTTVFDVLSPLATVPARNDWIVIDNQTGGDVYAGTNRAQIAAVPTTPRASDGLHRITIASTQFPSGYDDGRFSVVANAEQIVFYSCAGQTLYRQVFAFGTMSQSLLETICGSTASGAVVATNVSHCDFVYSPNQGATQQSGFVWMRLELTSAAGESVALAHGVHVDNLP